MHGPLILMRKNCKCWLYWGKCKQNFLVFTQYNVFTVWNKDIYFLSTNSISNGLASQYIFHFLFTSYYKSWYNLDGKNKDTLTFKLQNVDVPKALVIQKLTYIRIYWLMRVNANALSLHPKQIHACISFLACLINKIGFIFLW